MLKFILIQETETSSDEKLDWAGVSLLMVSVLSFMFRLKQIGETKGLQESAVTSALLLGGAGILLFILLLYWKQKSMVVVSILVGTGFGMMTNAPFSVLATRGREDHHGVAIGTVTLLLQTGLTIAPVLYGSSLSQTFSSLQERLESEMVMKAYFESFNSLEYSSLISYVNVAVSEETKSYLFNMNYATIGVRYTDRSLLQC